jgi:hypothetical protein
VFAGPIEAAADEATDPTLARKFAYERALATKLRQALAYVKGVVVDVTAEFTAVDAFQPVPAPAVEQPLQKQADANTPAELPAVTAAPPREKPRLAQGDVLASLHVSIAIPASYLEAVHAAGSLETAAADRAAADRAEIDRIRTLAARMLPATAAPDGCHVAVTSFPTPGSAPRQAPERAVARETGVPASASHPISLQQMLTRFVSSEAGSGQEAVPREILVAVGSVIAGLLAAILWVVGSHRRPAHAVPHQTASQHPRIDWSQIDGPRVGEVGPSPIHAQPFRSAA